MTSPPDDLRCCVVQEAPVLPADVRHHARALESCGLLRVLVTTYVHQPGAWLERAVGGADRLLGTHFSQRLRQRPTLQRVRPDHVVRRALPELWRVWRQRSNSAGAKSKSCAGHDAMMAAIDRKAGRLVRRGDRLVLGREDVALAAFRAGRRFGAGRLYQLPIAHYSTMRAIMQSEVDAFPAVCTMPLPQEDYSPERTDRKNAEIRAADHVLAPSLFVRDSALRAGVDAERITVIPFGTEPAWIPSESVPRDNTVLHVGQLSLRKGTHRLLRAWKKLGAHRTHRLQLIGRMHLAPSFLRNFQGCYECLGQLPRSELSRRYQKACFFALPSLAEGFAVVILEALSCGLPVLASRNSGAEGFITSGEEGLLHDAQDDDALCAGLDWMLSHPAERAEMSRRALEKARSWTWDDYRSEFLQLVYRLIGGAARRPCLSRESGE